jgi:hypothetical protein
VTDLVELAAAQLEQGDANASRRACWLARSAMEQRLDALLDAKDIEVGPRASTRSKLSCLEVAYADDADHPDLAHRAQYVWSRLSEACHQHAYQLSPTASEAAYLVELIRSIRQ